MCYRHWHCLTSLCLVLAGARGGSVYLPASDPGTSTVLPLLNKGTSRHTTRASLAGLSYMIDDVTI